MLIRFLRLKKPTLKFEEALVNQAERLVVSGEFENALDLFLALSIYKCQIQGCYKGNPDQVQINLIKNEAETGLRIFRISKGGDTARVIQFK
ncbi:hypothetical protein [Spirosoma panaciterrae]|uniref:hypothetical protein n=1 Tax=Spirosoma panaciterrae TaxID=496058 RepID=UPI00036CFC92|nr:hypothetical protein [Spirosoma panaciterrae]